MHATALLSLFSGLVFAIKAPTCPLGGPRNLIITYGPPASGKSGAYELWSKQMREDGCEAKKFEIIVDDLVAANPQYQLVARDLAQDAKPILRNQAIVEQCYSVGADEALCAPLFAAEKELCSAGWNNYSSYRQQANILSNSMLLEQAMIVGTVNDKPIQDVIYETTGSNGAYGWMLKVAHLAKAAGMKVHLVYPIVSLPNLKKRALSRAVGTDDKLGNGRLPCASIIEKIYGEAAQNLWKLMGSEDKQLFDSILITDNDGKEMKPVFFTQDMQKIRHRASKPLHFLTAEGKWPNIKAFVL